MRERVTISSTLTIHGALADICTAAAAAAESAISQDTGQEDPRGHAAARYQALQALSDDALRHMKSLEQDCGVPLCSRGRFPVQDARTYRGTRNRRGSFGTAITGNRCAPACTPACAPAVVSELPGDREIILNHLDHEDETPFAWGHTGPGTEQLASALLADATQDPEYARQHARKFRKEVVEKIRGEEWEMDGEEILGWVNDHP